MIYIYIYIYIYLYLYCTGLICFNLLAYTKNSKEFYINAREIILKVPHE